MEPHPWFMNRFKTAPQAFKWKPRQRCRAPEFKLFFSIPVALNLGPRGLVLGDVGVQAHQLLFLFLIASV